MVIKSLLFGGAPKRWIREKQYQTTIIVYPLPIDVMYFCHVFWDVTKNYNYHYQKRGLRYWLVSALGTDCYQPVMCVGEMVRELRKRQEVAGSNSGHHTHACASLFFLGLIYCFGQNYLSTGWSLHPKRALLGTGSFTRCQRSRPKVPVSGSRFKNRYLRPLLTGT